MRIFAQQEKVDKVRLVSQLYPITPAGSRQLESRLRIQPKTRAKLGHQRREFAGFQLDDKIRVLRRPSGAIVAARQRPHQHVGSTLRVEGVYDSGCCSFRAHCNIQASAQIASRCPKNLPARPPRECPGLGCGRRVPIILHIRSKESGTGQTACLPATSGAAVSTALPVRMRR